MQSKAGHPPELKMTRTVPMRSNKLVSKEQQQIKGLQVPVNQRLVASGGSGETALILIEKKHETGDECKSVAMVKKCQRSCHSLGSITKQARTLRRPKMHTVHCGSRSRPLKSA